MIHPSWYIFCLLLSLGYFFHPSTCCQGFDPGVTFGESSTWLPNWCWHLNVCCWHRTIFIVHSHCSFFLVTFPFLPVAMFGNATSSLIGCAHFSIANFYIECQSSFLSIAKLFPQLLQFNLSTSKAVRRDRQCVQGPALGTTGPMVFSSHWVCLIWDISKWPF